MSNLSNDFSVGGSKPVTLACMLLIIERKSPLDSITIFCRDFGASDTPSFFSIMFMYNCIIRGGKGFRRIVLTTFLILFILVEISEFAASKIGTVGSFRILMRVSAPP